MAPMHNAVRHCGGALIDGRRRAMDHPLTEVAMGGGELATEQVREFEERLLGEPRACLQPDRPGTLGPRPHPRRRPVGLPAPLTGQVNLHIGDIRSAAKTDVVYWRGLLEGWMNEDVSAKLGSRECTPRTRMDAGAVARTVDGRHGGTSVPGWLDITGRCRQVCQRAEGLAALHDGGRRAVTIALRHGSGRGCKALHLGRSAYPLGYSLSEGYPCPRSLCR